MTEAGEFDELVHGHFALVHAAEHKQAFRMAHQLELAGLDAEREAVEAEAALIQARGMRLVAAWRLAALTGSIL